MGRKHGMTQARAERAKEIVKLHHELGMTIEQAGKKLGVSRAQAQRDYRDAIRETFRPELYEHVMREFSRLETVHARAAAIMHSRESNNDDRLSAGQLIVKTSERRSRLLGLDAAVKFQVESEQNDALAQLAAAVEKYNPLDDMDATAED